MCGRTFNFQEYLQNLTKNNTGKPEFIMGREDFNKQKRGILSNFRIYIFTFTILQINDIFIILFINYFRNVIRRSLLWQEEKK